MRAQALIDDTLLLDLWLDASQVAGGVNPNPDSIYPHRSGRYREGGFHYRYENETGWYENLLRDLLSAAEGRRVRVLRSGNERITDEMLLASGLAADGDAAILCSLRRDLLTYAIDPMPTVFGSSSAGAMDLTKAAEASVNAVVHIGYSFHWVVVSWDASPVSEALSRS